MFTSFLHFFSSQTVLKMFVYNPDKQYTTTTTTTTTTATTATATTTTTTTTTTK